MRRASLCLRSVHSSAANVATYRIFEVEDEADPGQHDQKVQEE